MTEQSTVSFDVEKVAARLKETRAEEAAEERRAGYEFGVEWAEKVATLRELEQIAGQRTTIADHIYLALDDDHSARRYLLDLADEDPTSRNSDAFHLGFVEGAVAVYDAVSPHL